MRSNTDDYSNCGTYNCNLIPRRCVGFMRVPRCVFEEFELSYVNFGSGVYYNQSEKEKPDKVMYYIHANFTMNAMKF